MTTAPEIETDREPDYRFTLANERTFLAWIRTALGLVAGGIVVGQLYAAGSGPAGPRLISAVCAVLACVIALGAFRQWRRVQQAMRRDAPLPRPPLITATVTGVCVAALLSVALLAL
ncbi:YidH family protein [Nocardia carnea]|uniref:YidH family protein n=1 Tax=Nocardia carnea TaxID=37328 RepID=UPI002453CB85|nr:DUF202 domain-containing protein [Nocardia carnea]